VCKHILTKRSVPYAEDATLPALYGLAVEQINLHPKQKAERALKEICGSCFNAVNAIAALRNEDGDAHGKSPLDGEAHSLHAELAVNIAGAVATMLISAWETQQS
jgi:hypothetical protein